MRMFYLFTVVFFNFWVIGAIASNDYYGDMNSPTYFANKVFKNMETFDLDLSPECKSQMLYYATSLLSNQKTFWALKMFDAGTKIPSGIFTGNFIDFGFFEECIDIYDNATIEVISGKYCIGVLPFFSASAFTGQTLPKPRSILPSPDVGLQIATCLPSACSADEIQRVYRELFIPLKFHEDLCQVKLSQPKLDNADIAMISFLAIILGLIVSSTVYDGIIIYLKKKPLNPVLLAFSIITNGKKLIETTNKSDQISCIHGIRVITMMWIILGHKYGITLVLPIRSYQHLLEFIDEPANMFIMNAYVSVDTFFLLGGVVLAYTFLTAAENGVKFNLILYYIHRYLRLTPIVAVIVGIYLTIVKYFGSGPIWPGTVYYHLITSCEENWWRTLLYIQNFDLIGEEICIAQTWYLGVDFQLFLVSPLLLLPLKKWPRITLIIIGLLTACSSIATFLTSWFLDVSGNPFNQSDLDTSENYLKYYYYAPWIRCSPWLIGIIVGYAIFKIKRTQKELSINTIILFALWTASLAVLYVCVFVGYDVVIGNADKVTDAFHMALVRPAWAIALGWIIFACTTGYGGPVDWFLSRPMFQVISMLTYSMYLTHYGVLLVIGAQMITPPAFTNFRLLYGFWSDFMCILAVSIVFSLSFESPIIAIDKYFFQRSPAKVASP